MSTGQRLFVKITRESLPQVKDKYPFIYLERGRSLPHTRGGVST